MTNDGYPALFICADEASNKYQNNYLILIKSEYGLLLIAAILSMSLFNGKVYYLIYALIFVISISVLLTRTFLKPEQDWYRCRALAESVKTLTWRYMMRAEPFGDAPNLHVPQGEFRNQLHKIFRANKATAEKIDSNWSAEDQITNEMMATRSLPLAERKQRYSSERIIEQRTWYAAKAGVNKRQAVRWVVVAVVAYLIAGGLVLSRVAYPGFEPWPIEPVIVFASSIIGWMQIKKYNELGAAYTVTAHEIGMISPKIDTANNEHAFSGAVNEAELAFSREHTLWIARQTD